MTAAFGVGLFWTHLLTCLGFCCYWFCLLFFVKGFRLLGLTGYFVLCVCSLSWEFQRSFCWVVVCAYFGYLELFGWLIVLRALGFGLFCWCY